MTSRPAKSDNLIVTSQVYKPHMGAFGDVFCPTTPLGKFIFIYLGNYLIK